MKNNYCKKGFWIILSLLIGFSLISQPVVFALDFKDISHQKYDWARPYVDKMASLGVIKGTTKDNFSPDIPVTRAQAITMVIRLLGKEEAAKNKQLPATIKNADSIPNWVKGYIAYAIDKGIISEKDFSDFRANDAIKRHEVAVIVVRALGLESEAKTLKNVDLSFKDTFAIPLDSRSYVQIAVEKDVLNGFPDATFRPNDKVTRLQMAVILNNLERHIPSSNILKGTLEEKGINKPSITLRLDEGNLKTFVIDNDTVFYKNENESLVKTEFDDIKSSDKILLVPDLKSNKALYVEITESSIKEPVDDVVEKDIEDNSEEAKPSTSTDGVIRSAMRAVIPSANLILVDNLDTLEYERFELDQKVKVEKYGEKIDILELRNGDFVLLTLKNGKVSKIEVKPTTVHAKGVILDINFSSTYPELIVLDQNSKTKYNVAYDALVLKNSQKSDIMALRSGDEVALYIEYGHVVSIIAQSDLDYVSGTLKRVIISDDATVVIEDKKGKEYVVDITPRTELSKDGKTIKVSDLRKGYHLEIAVEGTEAVRIDCTAQKNQDTIIGVVKFINPNLKLIVIVEEDNGHHQLKYINFSKDSVLLRQNETMNIKRIKKGDKILAVGDHSGGIFFADIIVNLTIYD